MLYIPLSDNYGKPSGVSVTFERLETSDDLISFKIVATGHVGDTSRRLETEVSIQYASGIGDNQGFAVKHAILTSGSLSLGSNVSISLSSEEIARLTAQNQPITTWIASLSTSAKAVKINTSYATNGKVEILPDANYNVVDTTNTSIIEKTLSVDPFPPIDFEPIRTEAALVIADNTAIPNTGNLATLVSGRNINPTVAGTYVLPQSPTGTYYIPEMIFNIDGVIIHSDHDVLIVTDRLLFNRPISFSGSGEVSIYLTRQLNAQGQLIASNPLRFGLPTVQNPSTVLGRISNPHLLVVYIDEIKVLVNNQLVDFTLTSNNGLTIGGSFMFANASINLANNSTFAGYLITGGSNLIVSNNGDVFTTLYYVPNAHVVLQNNSALKGAIIASSFESGNSSNTMVIYDTTFAKKYPFNVISPIIGNEDDDGVTSLVFRVKATIEY